MGKSYTHKTKFNGMSVLVFSSNPLRLRCGIFTEEWARQEGSTNIPD
jgi:hypothetical protein